MCQESPIIAVRVSYRTINAPDESEETVQVKETTLQELIGGSKQFRVPLFQRTYSWRLQDHARFWRDILSQYGHLRQAMDSGTAKTGGHFIGSFVLAPSPSPAATPAFLVVDGQQRLTTLLLALCALRGAAAPTDPQAQERITNLFLINQYCEGELRWKFVPTEQDRPSFFGCVEGHVPSSEDLVVVAFRFYERQLALPGPDEEPLDYRLLEQVVVSRLSIVDITTEKSDNVYRIFESLNATGVGLTQGDLLRNYFFMLLPTRGADVYKHVWLPMEKELGTANLEGLARVDLLRRGIDVREDDVYREQQTRFDNLGTSEAVVEAEIRDLALRATHYAKIIQPEKEPDDAVHRHLAFFQRWKATTTHPLIMFLYDLLDAGVMDASQMAEILLNVESFLVRRLLVGVQSRNLNRIFVQLVQYLRQHPDEPTLATVRYQLSGERKYWATDDELKSAVQHRPFYHVGRAIQRRMVLERLEESFDHKEQGELAALPLSVEHIMPQSLSAAWMELLAASGEDPAALHSELLHTLGNLTLSGYNGELSNDPFERKQQIYDASLLSLNHELGGHQGWARSDIEQRGRDLADRAIHIWPAPVPGVAEATGTFDWSRVHAAIASIPDGWWTTYGDLGQIAGTSGQAVGYHVANAPSLPKAYRVLTSEGKISEGFHWASPDDARDPLVLLESEGVLFSNGHADPARHATAEELLRLMGQLDVEDLIEEGTASDA